MGSIYPQRNPQERGVRGVAGLARMWMIGLLLIGHAAIPPSVLALTGQTISFTALSGKNLGAAPFTVSATASSGLVVGFASLTTTTCTVSGVTVTLLAVGTCTIRASQPGNVSFAAASPVERSFGITVNAVIQYTYDPAGNIATIQRVR